MYIYIYIYTYIYIYMVAQANRGHRTNPSARPGGRHPPPPRGQQPAPGFPGNVETVGEKIWSLNFGRKAVANSCFCP